MLGEQMLKEESGELGSDSNLVANLLCNFVPGARPLWTPSLQQCMPPPDEENNVRKAALYL